MSDISGRGSLKPFAFFDPEQLCWKTSRDIFGSDSTSSLATWPQWGELRDGVLFEHPTPEHLTADRSFVQPATVYPQPKPK